MKLGFNAWATNRCGHAQFAHKCQSSSWTRSPALWQRPHKYHTLLLSGTMHRGLKFRHRNTSDSFCLTRHKDRVFDQLFSHFKPVLILDPSQSSSSKPLTKPNSGLFGHFSLIFCLYHVVKWFLLLSVFFWLGVCTGVSFWKLTFTHLLSFVSMFINSRGKYLVILRDVIQLVAN